ncbi:hypothetical protein [Saccharophagus degradans]|nr:hypothetical protein [Saccharophagus degradans]
MRNTICCVILSMLSLFVGSLAVAQAVEEVIVTGMRASGDELPGVVFRRQADFLLLEVTVLNDSRNEEIREKEILKTLQNALSIAKAQKDIELSIVKNGFVLPLVSVDSSIEIVSGDRPDTSQVKVRAKTNIPKNLESPEKLLAKLTAFTESVPVEGRTELIAYDEPDVSVVNPHQYRSNIIELVAKDVNTTTSALGKDYRVIMQGLDQPVQWVRVGPVQLAMYIPYSYHIIPSNISSFFSPDY